MQTILIGTLVLSVSHALIPSHWLPILAIGRQDNWTDRRILSVTLLVGLAHVLSTILLGVGLAYFGGMLTGQVEFFTKWLSPLVLVGLGVFYLYQHYHHHHFHLHKADGRFGVVISLSLAMFLSPCLEIEGYFLSAMAYGWGFIGTLALLYGVITLLGMMIWVQLALKGLNKLDWHAWEHQAGIITGLVLIVSGLLLLMHG